MAVGDIYSVVHVGTIHNQTVNITGHWKETVSGGTGGAAQLAGNLQARFVGQFLPLLSNEFTLVGTQAQRVLPTPPSLPVLNVTSSAAGGIATPAAPINAPFTITKRTDFAGQRYRGRWYVPGISTADIDDSKITGLAVSVFQSAANSYFASTTGGGYTFVPVLLHRDNLSHDLITSVVVRATLRNLRRRQVGVGI